MTILHERDDEKIFFPFHENGGNLGQEGDLMIGKAQKTLLDEALKEEALKEEALKEEALKQRRAVIFMPKESNLATDIFCILPVESLGMANCVSHM